MTIIEYATRFNVEPYPHAPRLLLIIVHNSPYLMTNMVSIKEFSVIMDVIEPYYHGEPSPRMRTVGNYYIQVFDLKD
ncbi:MAG: hypothetical protein AB7V56_13730 [Candidatus Nitrosocosmicus sp.]